MAPSSGKKKQQLKIAGITTLLQLPTSDSEAAARVAHSVREALEQLAAPQAHTSSKSGSAAAVAHVGVILQAVGWLARARFQQHHTKEVYTALFGALLNALDLATTILKQRDKRDKLTLEHLRPALRPCPEDGVTPGE
jgi:hypothetical protein